jgi:hypothetical protein
LAKGICSAHTIAIGHNDRTDSALSKARSWCMGAAKGRKVTVTVGSDCHSWKMEVICQSPPRSAQPLRPNPAPPDRRAPAPAHRPPRSTAVRQIRATENDALRATVEVESVGNCERRLRWVPWSASTLQRRSARRLALSISANRSAMTPRQCCPVASSYRWSIANERRVVHAQWWMGEGPATVQPHSSLSMNCAAAPTKMMPGSARRASACLGLLSAQAA